MNKSKEKSILIIAVVILAVFVVLLSSQQLQYNVKLKFIVLTANLPDNKAKDFLITFIQRNSLSLFLRPLLKHSSQSINGYTKASDLSADILNRAVSADDISYSQIHNSLFPYTRDRDKYIRQSAFFYLFNNLKIENRTKALLKTARTYKDDDIQEVIIISFSIFSDPQATDYLLQQLQAQNVILRREAAYALLQTGDPKSLPGLLEALKDSDPQVKEHVIRTLGIIGNKETIKYLLPFTNSNNQKLKDFSIESINEIKRRCSKITKTGDSHS